MNIEEAVRTIRELIDGVKEYGYDYTVEEAVVINKSEYTAIETLLTVYEKQQKEIEELKDKYSDEKIRNTVIKRYREVIEKDYVSKDKIKAKIKEAEEIIKEDRKELNFGTTLRDDILQGIVYKIDFNTRLKNILESLLEKE